MKIKIINRRIILSTGLILLFLFCSDSFLFARLNEDEIAKKTEGSYFTGIPLINFSSDDGLGYGLRLYFYNNGQKTDPEFVNIPYNTQIYIQYFSTTEGYQYHELNLDSFNVFNTGFRVITSISYEEYLNANFFGTSAGSARQKLTDVNGNTYNTYNDYLNKFLKANNYSDYKYNKYTSKSPEYHLDIYRDIMESFKFLFGFELRYVNITPWDGRTFQTGILGGSSFRQTQPTLLTLLHPDGYNGGWTNFARIGIAYDTRDFEPDPTRGVYIDYVFDIDNEVLGSRYNFYRSTAGARFYINPFKPFVITGRIAYTDSSGDVPFYEMNTFSFLYNRYNGLGGSTTLRGFQQDRFVGLTMTMGNLEVRYSFAEIVPYGQRFNFKLVAFVDAGNVYDKAGDPFTDPRFNDYKIAYGGGLVVAWNENTIIHFYYGISREDSSISIDFNHSLD